jgi:hypothetical protein
MAKRTFSSFTKYLYPFLLTLVLFSFPSGAAHAQPSSPTFADLVRMSQEKEVIHHFDVTASADKEGFVTVREKIELTALGKEIKRGIIRVFPTDYETADGMIQRTGFELLSTTLDGAPVQNYVEREGGNIEIRLGSSDIILERGRHVYEITYKTRGWIAFREEFDEFYWNVTGNDWIFPIQKASYRVTLPDGGQVLKFAGFTGYKGESGEDFRRLPDGSFETTRPLKKGEGLSITVAWEKGLVEMPPLPLMEKLERMFHFNRGPAITFFVVITALYYAAAWLWKGRDKPLGPVIPLFSPPAGVEAGYVKYFKDREYSTDALAANILQLAVDGAIRFSGEKDDLKIIPSGKSADELNLQSPLADVYRLMPAGRKMAVDDSSGPVFYEMEQKLRIAYLKRSKAHFASNLPLAIIGLIPLILLMAAGPWLGGAIMEFFAYDAGAGFYAAFIIMMLLPSACKNLLEGIKSGRRKGGELRRLQGAQGKHAPGQGPVAEGDYFAVVAEDHRMVTWDAADAQGVGGAVPPQGLPKQYRSPRRGVLLFVMVGLLNLGVPPVKEGAEVPQDHFKQGNSLGKVVALHHCDRAAKGPQLFQLGVVVARNPRHQGTAEPLRSRQGFVQGARQGEINQHVRGPGCLLPLPGEGEAELVGGEGLLYLPAHPPRGPYKAVPHSLTPQSFIVSSMRAAHFSDAGTRGRRSSLRQYPRRLTQYFTGMGLASTKRFFIRGSILWWRARAPAVSPARASLTISDVSFGIMLESTEITPSPPELTRWKA